MNIKLRKYLGKAFLLCTSFFWFSCDNANSEFPVNPPNIADQNSSSSSLTNENTSSSSLAKESSSSNESLSSSAQPSSSAKEYSSSATALSSSNNAQSSSSNTPASSSSKLTSKDLPKVSFLDIDQIIEKNHALSDTAGLMGKKVSASDYCRTTLQGVRYNFYDSALPTSSRNTAKDMIDDEVDSLLASPQAATFSEEKQKCILDLKYSSWDALPDYGIPIWYSCEHENEGKDSVKIDEAYIRALEARNELFYDEYMDVFKETVNKAVRCDSLK
jgi:RNA-binding protein of the Puf family, translational repressor